jgi:hypothetical protein
LRQEVAMFVCADAVALDSIQNLSCHIGVAECGYLKMILEAFIITCNPYIIFNLQTY